MYADVVDLRARLGSSIYSEIYSSDLDAENDLADAQAEIDGCLSRRYQVPVTALSVQSLLRGWTLTLCEERTYSRAAGSGYAEKLAGRVAQVRKYLSDVMTGAFSLPGAEENTSSGLISMTAGDEPIFTRENLKGY